MPLVELDSAGVTGVLDESEELEEVSRLDDSELAGNGELELVDELEFSLEELELIELEVLEPVDELELSLDELELALALSSKTTVSLAAEVMPSALIV